MLKQVINFHIFLYSKVTGAGKKEPIFFFHFLSYEGSEWVQTKNTHIYNEK